MEGFTNEDKPLRWDATDFVWFKRELEFVEATQYEVVNEGNLARDLIPTQNDVPDWADAVIWREYEKIGKAKILGSNVTDLPRVDVQGRENHKMIKDIGDSYGWTVKELKRMQATGRRLDVMRAAAARFAIETETDEILALGNEEHNLDGILKLDLNFSITPVTAITKTGGGTNWTAAAKPDEIAGDVFKLIDTTLGNQKQSTGPTGEKQGLIFRSFRVVLPDVNVSLMAQRRMGDGSDSRILDFVKGSPFVESVNGWHRCVGAAANDTDDRMAIYPPSKLVVAGVVPQEFTPQDPEKRGLEFIIACTGSCGGVLLRYSFAIGYMDAIDRA